MRLRTRFCRKINHHRRRRILPRGETTGIGRSLHLDSGLITPSNKSVRRATALEAKLRNKPMAASGLGKDTGTSVMRFLESANLGSMKRWESRKREIGTGGAIKSNSKKESAEAATAS
jgi:hypothetical protein